MKRISRKGVVDSPEIPAVIDRSEAQSGDLLSCGPGEVDELASAADAQRDAIPRFCERDGPSKAIFAQHVGVSHLEKHVALLKTRGAKRGVEFVFGCGAEVTEHRRE